MGDGDSQAGCPVELTTPLGQYEDVDRQYGSANGTVVDVRHLGPQVDKGSQRMPVS